jgi:uncharacterized protein YndB with AHSA1/START domain
MTRTGGKPSRYLRVTLASVAALAGVALVYGAVLRPRATTATPVEVTQPLAGDDLIAWPVGSLTHAVTIAASPREVWPWLVQMGAGRAGWYSYDFIDNGRVRSAERVLPELQHIAVGDVMPALPGVTEGFTVLRVEPERALVIGWLSPEGAPITTWAFVLEERNARTTRLIVRSRASTEYEPPFGLPRWAIHTLVPWGHAVMEGKQLRGIRDRAERIAVRAEQ